MDRTHSFGYWLRRRRKALDLTQAELAQRVSCSLDLIQKIEADARRPSRQLAERLAGCLDIDATERVDFVQAARAERAVDQLALPTQPFEQPQRSSRNNLPAQLTALIGRERELASVGALLRRADMRLLTLTGPGGVGKTRLGLQAAADLVDDFPDGVYFVDLAPIRDPNLVSGALAQALGVRESGGLPLLDCLKNYLRDKRTLLLLDNFEQVLDAAPLVADLLATAPQLTLMVTSREPLHLRGEQEVPVPPLALPPTDDGRRTTDDHMSQYAAVALFVQRAQAVQPTFHLTNANAAAVAEICVRLDGLPLAIELAAARVKLFAPEALLARLNSRLALLTGGARDLPNRQQTIRRTIDWSYDLLNETEQTLFRRLGVFVGGCTLEAVEAVCNAEDDLPVEVLDGLAALVDKSLLKQAEGAAGEPRFTMLETIREYALERFEASGEAEQLRRQHAGYFEAFSSDQPAGDDETWLRRVDPDYDNVRSALEWSQTTAGDPETALWLVSALSSLWLDRGIRHEAIATLRRILDHSLSVGRTLAFAHARVELGHFLAMIGNYAAAQAEYEQALPLVYEQGDSELHTFLLSRLGWLAREQGDSATAWAWLTQSLARFRELGHAGNIAETLNTLAEVAILDENPARAEALLMESRVIEQHEHAGPYSGPKTAGWTLNHLGHAAQLRGEYQRAAELHQESLAIFRSMGDQHFGLPWAYQSLGETELGLGRLDEAARWLAQGLALSQTLSDQASIAWCLAGLGSVAALDEEPERAVRLWGAAERLRQTIGCRPAPAARATYERAIAVARGQLGEAAFAAAWTFGQAMPLEQAISEALEDAAEAPSS